MTGALELLLEAARKRRGIDELSITEHVASRARRELGRSPVRRVGREHTLTITVFSDRRQGRGQASWIIDPTGDVMAQLDMAVQHAQSSLGPAWRLPRPAAPALVEVSDEDWARNPEDGLREVAAALASALPGSLQLTDARLSLSVEDTRVATSTGFDNRKRSTVLEIEGEVVARQGLPTPLRTRVRRRADLALAELFEACARRSLRLARSTPLPPVSCDLVLELDAHAPPEAVDFGIWSPIASQAQAQLASTGLARYQEGQSIEASDAEHDRLTIQSDGAARFKLRSAPFAEHGAPVRRFTLVKEGIAAGLALDVREAALRGVIPNGGVRNLVIGAGSDAIAALHTPGARPLVIAHDLASWSTTARGDLQLELGTCTRIEGDHSGSPQHTEHVGGLVFANLFELLVRTRLSSVVRQSGWCEGPEAVRFDDVSIR